MAKRFFVGSFGFFQQRDHNMCLKNGASATFGIIATESSVKNPIFEPCRLLYHLEQVSEEQQVPYIAPLDKRKDHV